MKVIADLIQSFDPSSPNFRPTEIFNENWLLKAFLHQCARSDLINSAFSVHVGSTWFSEALLPTAFRARHRGDVLAESRTNSDGVVGHIEIGEKGKADLQLRSGARQFVVIEAKINSPLSSGTSNAPGFDQAARNVACMAEVLRRASLPPSEIDTLSFIVLAPASAIDAGTFTNEMDLDGMQHKIASRVAAYEGELEEWYAEWAMPTLDAISLHSIAWEQAIQDLANANPETVSSLDDFYGLCLDFN